MLSRAEITYAHISSPDGAFRFRRYAADLIPEWATDVRALVEVEEDSDIKTSDTGLVNREWFSAEIEKFANDPQGVFVSSDDGAGFLYDWY